MERKKMIEEIVSIMGEWAIENRMCWNSKHAESLVKYLMGKNVLKIPEGSVVLTKEELADTQARVAYLQEELGKLLRGDNISVSAREYGQLLYEKENARKETAREIFKALMEIERNDGFTVYIFEKRSIKELAEKYGVDVEE